MGGGLDVVTLLGELADIGRDPRRGGYSRHVFDEAEGELRRWFTGHACDLGLSVLPDGNGNLWAWWGTPGPGAVLTGSHLDSVPGGGAYDGPLGVASALAAVSALQSSGLRPPGAGSSGSGSSEMGLSGAGPWGAGSSGSQASGSGVRLARPLAVVVFAEEEGSRFGRACLGSKLAAGQVAAGAVRSLAGPDGVTFAEAALRAGIDPAGLGPVRWAAEASCFVELHVEQGRGLADLGAPVAVATGILAHGRWRLDFGGEGNHAGTTRMTDRHDPVVAAARTLLAARDLALHKDADVDAGVGAGDAGARDASAGNAGASAAGAARATVGRAELIPGGTNVIASRASLWLDCRAGTDAALSALVADIAGAARAASAAEGCTVSVAAESVTGRVDFDAALRTRVADLLPSAPLLATGAGHDAGVLAALIPTAMLFVRNPTGVSHAPAEAASDDDCRAGAAALTTVLRDLGC